VVADAVRISEATLAEQGIQVEVFSEPMPLVLLDEQKFLGVLVNLIGNARHACMESDVADKCVKIWVQHDADHVSVKIQDNGIGIDPAVQKRIFNHGFTTRKGGHGFGLHSVALAIEESCGSINVQSDGVGLGATFSIRIPVVTAAQRAVLSRDSD
jgi:signal transduction histidine kinase